MDPLAVIFIPGGLTAGALLFGAPIATIGYLAWRWRAQRRVERGSCGRCGESFAGDAARFLVTGVHICAPCADNGKFQRAVYYEKYGEVFEKLPLAGGLNGELFDDEQVYGGTRPNRQQIPD